LWCAATADKSLVTLKDRDDRQIMKLSRCLRYTRSLDIFISYLRFNVVEWGEREKLVTLQEFYTMNDDGTRAEDILRMWLYVFHDRPI
jgi:hypothetical protein